MKNLSTTKSNDLMSDFFTGYIIMINFIHQARKEKYNETNTGK